MSENTQTRVVKALYNFKPKNTDELAFSKGDLITLTQMVEGGWWEGTLNDKTGWFPSNYVKEVKSDTRAGAKSPKPGDLAMNKRESMAFYHNVVLQSLIDTERNLVTELHTLLQSYLRPLQSANIFSSTDYMHLVGNLEDIAVLHQNLLLSLDDCAKQPISQQRIGGLFMKHGPQLQNLYKTYCANHPLAVQVLQAYRDELNAFMENNGAPTPGIMKLTTSVSLPFTRLDKYPNLLKELQRHTEESHPDRGDTQRAISVYREIAASCVDIRKQKELEYEIMNSPIKGWEGDEIHDLGEVLVMTHVKVHTENGEKKDRLFVLFPGLLVMVSVSPRMSGYIYEGKIPVSGMTINPVEDTDNLNNIFEISGKMIDKRVVSCTSKTDQQQWIDVLRKQSKISPAKAQSLKISSTQPSVKTIPPSLAKTARVLMQPLSTTTNTHSSSQNTNKMVSGGVMFPMPWSMSCLRPSPPLRPQLLMRGDGGDMSRSPKTGRKLLGTYRKKPVDDHKSLEEDTLILKVIEAYCTSAKARHTVNSLDLRKLRVSERANIVKAGGIMNLINPVITNHARTKSALLDSPHVLIAEEEKIIVEELKGNETIVEEKSLVDTVYHLRDQVRDLKQEQMKMKKDLEEETKARKKLESYLRKSLRSVADTTSGIYTDSEQGAPS